MRSWRPVAMASKANPSACADEAQAEAMPQVAPILKRTKFRVAPVVAANKWRAALQPCHSSFRMMLENHGPQQKHRRAVIGSRQRSINSASASVDSRTVIVQTWVRHSLDAQECHLLWVIHDQIAINTWKPLIAPITLGTDFAVATKRTESRIPQ